eukprot:Pgem_evm1s13685
MSVQTYNPFAFNAAQVCANLEVNANYKLCEPEFWKRSIGCDKNGLCTQTKNCMDVLINSLKNGQTVENETQTQGFTIISSDGFVSDNLSRTYASVAQQFVEQKASPTEDLKLIINFDASLGHIQNGIRTVENIPNNEFAMLAKPLIDFNVLPSSMKEIKVIVDLARRRKQKMVCQTLNGTKKKSLKRTDSF